MSKEQELKKYCLEQAIAASPADKQTIVQLANDFHDFLTKEQVVHTKLSDGKEVVIKKHLKTLTVAQKRILRAAIELDQKGEKWINGSEIARSLKPALTQSCVSTHLKAIVKAGYMSREGNRFYPKYLPNGELYSPVVKKYPAMPANGYKMKDVARMNGAAIAA